MSYVDPIENGGMPAAGGVIGHQQADDEIVDIEYFKTMIPVAQFVAPATSSYAAALGDRAAITLGTTTTGTVPSGNGVAATQEIVITAVAGSGSCSFSITGGGNFIGANGSTTTLSLSNLGDTYILRPQGNSSPNWIYS